MPILDFTPQRIYKPLRTKEHRQNQKPHQSPAGRRFLQLHTASFWFVWKKLFFWNLKYRGWSENIQRYQTLEDTTAVIPKNCFRKYQPNNRNHWKRDWPAYLEAVICPAGNGCVISWSSSRPSTDRWRQTTDRNVNNPEPKRPKNPLEHIICIFSESPAELTSLNLSLKYVRIIGDWNSWEVEISEEKRRGWKGRQLHGSLLLFFAAVTLTATESNTK